MPGRLGIFDISAAFRPRPDWGGFLPVRPVSGHRGIGPMRMHGFARRGFATTAPHGGPMARVAVHEESSDTLQTEGIG